MKDFIYSSNWNDNVAKDFKLYFENLYNSEHIAFDTQMIRTSKQVLGIRVPVIRQIAKEIAKTDVLSFLDCFKPVFHEEYLLYAFMITKIKEYKTFQTYFDNFVPHIDNWAICDLLVGDSKIIGKHLDDFFPCIKKYLKAEQVFVRRVGIVCLMKYYLAPDWIGVSLELLKNMLTEEYYINMALGWFICECFIKDKTRCTTFLQNANLHPLAIKFGLQKIRDSFRVKEEDKRMITNLIKVKPFKTN